MSHYSWMKIITVSAQIRGRQLIKKWGVYVEILLNKTLSNWQILLNKVLTWRSNQEWRSFYADTVCYKWYLIALQFNIDRSSWLLLVDHSTSYMAQVVDYMSTTSYLSNHTNARYFHHIHSTNIVPQPNLMACCRHCRLHYHWWWFFSKIIVGTIAYNYYCHCWLDNHQFSH